ncbi:tRNA pseudouridine55 synthase [Neisseria sp. HSC-16F19]|nr:tRNA pseudouridine(55) synthase TruB [Neisseria sp. HSC-16F19]MCP2039538.1 tRNA pseudouridine55 synthase [Neisseria sp. HSC-16F19]
MNTPKAPKRAVNGVLLLDKPAGISSNTALQQARRLFAAQKAGHTGVLDPLATGLLPLCFGEATKFAQYLLDADKAYTATLKLGEATTTGDAEGDIIECGRSDIGVDEFQAACAALTGPIRQVPPMFSALKHEGRPLYEYARRGITIERKARDITIYQIDILEFAPPQAVLAVRCSKGTYIRTLAEDLARHLGSFAHLTALRRTATAGFDIAAAHSLEVLAALDTDGRDALLLPCDVLVQHLPAVQADAATVADVQCGRRAPFSGSLPNGQPLRLYAADTQDFVGLVEYLPQGCLKAVRLMNTAAD